MRNLVSNPGFEEGFAHWTMTAADSYVCAADPHGANIRPHGGKKMLYSTARSESFEVHAGRTLRVAVWKRYESTIEVPPNTTKAQLVISSEYGRIDDIEVIEVI